MELSTARTMTPTSAKMARDMPTMPSAPEDEEGELDAYGKGDVGAHDAHAAAGEPMASGSLAGSSSIITTSAASMAASEPSAPIAMPTSARGKHRRVVHAVAHEGDPCRPWI